MIPNIHIHEQLMFERCQERQRAADQQRLVAGLRWSRTSPCWKTRRSPGRTRYECAAACAKWEAGGT